jgi:hypothetical protein
MMPFKTAGGFQDIRRECGDVATAVRLRGISGARRKEMNESNKVVNSNVFTTRIS